MRRGRPFTRWAPEHVATLISMAEAGASWAVIADALSRGQIACQTKWRELRSPEERARTRVAKLAAINAASTTAAPRAPRRDSRAAEIIVARRAPQRPPQVGAAPRSLTALVLGDPPPGRSALDQLTARGPLR